MSNIIFNPETEQHLSEIVQQAQRSQWLAENQSALDEYSCRI